ncbi:MAG: hypothetical protein J6386_09065 [Candidatus Synoicihabitans palmerolidicus]|nr:hypothetical protein [Candidatus Synoicihabitans palmerolidicus]
MVTTTLSSTQADALRDLLDDPSPTVRRGLCHHLSALGPTARDCLREIADGTNRHLVWHARSYLEELNFTDPIGEFREFIRSLNYELATGALLLARTVRPRLDAGACCEELDRIAARGRELILDPTRLPRAKNAVSSTASSTMSSASAETSNTIPIPTTAS